MKTTFSIKKMLVNDTTDKIVKNVSWRIEFFNDAGENIGYEEGDTLLGEPNQESFIAYETLTLDNVVEWITPLLPIEGMYQAALNRKFQEENKNKKPETPPNIMTPPWMQQPQVRNPRRSR